MNYTLKHLKYFVAACEEESVKRAAEKLNISQPSVSAAIAHLEGVFNVQLFIRHHARGLALTPAGRRLLGRANLLIKQAEDLHQYATDLGDSLTGQLDVGCFVTLAPIFMPPLIRAFQEGYPNVRIRCVEGDQEFLYQGLLRGDYELSLVYDLGPSQDIELRSVSEFPPYVMLPPQHKLARRKQVALSELVDDPMILLDLPQSRQYFERLFFEAGLAPNIAHRTPSPNMVRGLVANGLGYSLLNARIGLDQTLDGQRFASLPLKGKYEPLKLSIAHLSGVDLTRAASTFAEFSAEQIPKIVESEHR